MTAVLKGGKELQAKFNALATRTQGQTLRDAVLSGGEVIRDDAIPRAPRGATGRLREGIDVEIGRSTPKKATANIGWRKDVFYGRFQELGTRYHAARPHLRPAHDARQADAIREIGRVIRRVIDRVRLR